MRLMHDDVLHQPPLDVVRALASVTPERLEATVRALSYPRHRAAQPRANEEAARFIADALEQMGYAVELAGELRNVVAVPREGIAPRLLVGAHYDSVPMTPGADDNASGVAGMLACAAALAPAKGLAIEFVAWNGEEDGLLGSTEFAGSLGAAANTLSAVHVFEMIGCCRRERGSQRAPLRWAPGMPKTGDFIGLLGNQRARHLVKQALSLRPALTPSLPVVALQTWAGVERWLPVLHRSDHSPFWNAGVPAMLWTDTAEFRNPHYHRPTDRPETLDYAFMTEVTRLALGCVLHDPRLIE